MKQPRATNTYGIRYLNKGNRGKKYVVKIEIGCVGGKHGKMEYFYVGDDYDLAVWFANKVNQLISKGGHTAALEWKDYDMAREVSEWQAQNR